MSITIFRVSSSSSLLLPAELRPCRRWITWPLSVAVAVVAAVFVNVIIVVVVVAAVVVVFYPVAVQFAVVVLSLLCAGRQLLLELLYHH